MKPLLAFALIAPSFPMQAVAGFDDPMTFHHALTGGNCVTCQWIAAEGVIEADTHERFLEFLAQRDLLDARALNIHLNSPGGSLAGGVALGLAIRAQEANTVVSAGLPKEVWAGGELLMDVRADSECSSACVFAFAGGVSRYASKTTPPHEIGFQSIGRLGVHQFYAPLAMADPEALFNAEDRISDQKIIAILLQYLATMDISAELLQLAAQTDPRDMHFLTEDELQRTGDNQMVRDVSITGYRNGVGIIDIRYMRRDADYRMEIYCGGGKMNMLAVINWRDTYSVSGHEQWNLYDGLTLNDGTRVALISETFDPREDGGTTGNLHFQFEGALANLVKRKDFQFEDFSSRYASNAARDMSFTLPENFEGLHLLPRVCLE